MKLTKEQVQAIVDLINTYTATETNVENTYFEHFIVADEVLLAALQPLMADRSYYANVQVGTTLDMIQVFDSSALESAFTNQNPASYRVVFDYTNDEFVVLTHDNTTIICDDYIQLYLYHREATGEWLRFANDVEDEYMYTLDVMSDTDIHAIRTFMNTH